MSSFRPPPLVGLLLLLACDPSVEDNGNPISTCKPNQENGGVEVCNNQDDDCDGVTDEGASGARLRQPCETNCGYGTEECVGGTWQGCNAPVASVEICNGLDDNCNDETDEGCNCVHGSTQPCGSDVGACRAGIQQCLNGEWQTTCHGEVGPADHEICNNGVDDNCDTRTDEDCQCAPNQTQTCGTDVGACQAGELRCGTDGKWETTCNDEIQPSPERCNGLDDDCDGREDWTIATGIGWQADEHENNDQCTSATPLPNAESSGGWIKAPVSDPTNLMTFPSIYPVGDVDWFAFRAVEDNSGSCTPGTQQCSYILTVQLELPSTVDQADYEMCVAVSDCSSITSTSMFCSNIDKWVPDASSYVLGVRWAGVCSGDDSRDVKVVVRNSGQGNVCEYYQVHARFYFDPNETC